MSRSKWSALGLGAILVVAAVAFAGDRAFAGDGEDAPKGPVARGPVARGPVARGPVARGPVARGAAMRERARQQLRRRRGNSMQFLESLQATDEQRNLVLEKAKAAAPILSEARRQARALVAQAMAGSDGRRSGKDKGASKADRLAARQAVKAQLQTIRDQTRGQIDALAKDVVASLTPEQRQKLQDVASKRGKTLDDARLTRFAAALISRPMTAAYLEAKQAK